MHRLIYNILFLILVARSESCWEGKSWCRIRCKKGSAERKRSRKKERIWAGHKEKWCQGKTLAEFIFLLFLKSTFIKLDNVTIESLQNSL